MQTYVTRLQTTAWSASTPAERRATGTQTGPTVMTGTTGSRRVPGVDDRSRFQTDYRAAAAGRPASYAAIGKAVGLSEAAVRQRVQRLTDAGVMQIVAVTDPMMLGFHRQTMIGIKCEGDLERVADHLAGMDEIDYVVITSGSFDLLVEVVCEDDDQLLEILSRVRMLRRP